MNGLDGSFVEKACDRCKCKRPKLRNKAVENKPRSIDIVLTRRSYYRLQILRQQNDRTAERQSQTRSIAIEHVLWPPSMFMARKHMSMFYIHEAYSNGEKERKRLRPKADGGWGLGGDERRLDLFGGREIIQD